MYFLIFEISGMLKIELTYLGRLMLSRSDFSQDSRNCLFLYLSTVVLFCWHSFYAVCDPYLDQCAEPLHAG